MESEEPEEQDELTPLLRRMRQVYDEREATRAREKELTALYDSLNRRATDIFESRQVGSMRIPGVATFYTKTKVYPSVKDAEKLHEWLREQGAGELIKPTVHPQTLIAFVNERMENGEEPPPEDVCSVFPKTTVAIRRV